MYGTLEGDPIHLAGSPVSRSRFYGHSSSPRGRYYDSYSHHAPRTTFSQSLGPSLGRSYYMGSGHVSTAAYTIHAPSTPLAAGPSAGLSAAAAQTAAPGASSTTGPCTTERGG
eukprot:CAMPEP_0175270130 /NCGR_PEP_ID=MMETSP0093-20121207/45222_1 /TAXON_ID=311494 /ORGANISM="Alexandrium monilatum, Strain CCMP3105" /LENGTH=112 /DNA_ID=CAMNT_0016564821 /DNA_START=97 /DNA_END=432 /DNA_ORIENTATION=+